MRVAFYGSAGCRDGAEEEILDQFQGCEGVLAAGEEVVGVYFDVGRPVGRSQSALPEGFGLERDGGLIDLTLDARLVSRPFDVVVTASPSHLSADPQIFLRTVRELLIAGVPVRMGGHGAGCAGQSSALGAQRLLEERPVSAGRGAESGGGSGRHAGVGVS
ncbi:hypothetical protein GCM10027589_38620 [Actinocorallia lasiicapitis]